MNIASLSMAASLTIMAVILIRLLFIHVLPKKTFMLLWGIVIFRLLIPVSIPSRLSIWNIIDAIPAALQKEAAVAANLPAIGITEAAATIPFNNPVVPMVKIPEAVTETGINASSYSAVVSSQKSSPAGLSFLFWLWLAGAIACGVFFIFPHLRWRNIYKTALPMDNNFLRQWKTGHPLKRSLCIKQSDLVDSPLTYGIFKPVILLPKNLDWRAEKRLSYILTHEYIHIRRFDILWKWILAITLAVHWFNPLVWVMFMLANRDMELYCDETVVQKYIGYSGDSVKTGYALTLVSLVEKQNQWISLYANFSRNVVEERVVSIMKIRKFSYVAVLSAILLICCITMVFATGKTLPPAMNDNDAVLTDATGNFIRVSGGSYLMGPVEDFGYGYPMEIQHEVSISSFYLAKSRVTQGEYREVMGINPVTSKDDDKKPAEQVSWFDALEFCNRLSMREGLMPAYTINGDTVTWDTNANGYRLPTEAEWEFAARAGTSIAFPDDGTHPWGFISMPGMISEWCWDWFESYTSEAQINPAGAVTGTYRIIRGGHWPCGGRSGACTIRNYSLPTVEAPLIGFRLAYSSK